MDRHYTIEHTSEHRAKFCGDQLTKLGDLTRKKENKWQQNMSAPKAIASRWTNKRMGLLYFAQSLIKNVKHKTSH